MLQRLPLPFYVDCGGELPLDVKLHDPSSAVWKGKYVKKSKSISELTAMMTFYGIKPYHMVLVKYEGGPDFKFQVYNSYAVEIKYPMDKYSSKLDFFCNSIEVDKLGSNFTFNAIGNFGGVHYLHIKQKHMWGCLFTEVSLFPYNFYFQLHSIGDVIH